MRRINWRLTARSRSGLSFARRKGVRVQATEPGTPVTGPIPVTTSAPRPLAGVCGSDSCVAGGSGTSGTACRAPTFPGAPSKTHRFSSP